MIFVNIWNHADCAELWVVQRKLKSNMGFTRFLIELRKLSRQLLTSLKGKDQKAGMIHGTDAVLSVIFMIFIFCLLFLLRFSIFNSLYMLEAADFILSAEVVGILWWVNKWTLCKAIQHCRVFGINIFRILHFCFYNHCIAWWFGLWVCVTLIALMNLILILLIIKMFNLLHTLEMLNPLKSFEVIHWKFWNLRPNCHFSWVFNY